MTKICKKCGHDKPLAEYHRSKGYADGYFSKCKVCCNQEKAAYVANNRDKVRESQRKYESKNREHRKQYNKNWQNENREHVNKQNRSFYQNNIEYCRSQGAARRLEHRKKALKMLGGAVCVGCGCDKFELLEVNHKNGNGRQEIITKWKSSSALVRAIVMGNRSVDDLDVRCKLCNNLHYLEMKHGTLPFKVTWQKS